MKSVVKKMGFALIALIMLGACKEVDTIVPNDSKSSIGYLLVSGMEASILEDTENVATPSTRAEGIDINNFDVVITNAAGEVVSTFKYGERPTEPIALEGGVYKIAMSSAAMQGAAWEMPVYAGEREVIITRKQTTEVNNFVCKLANIKVTVPDEFTGDVMGDLNKRRGRVLGMTPIAGGNQIVEADIPMTGVFGYCTVLRSMTGGRGTYSYEFARYEQAPSDVQAAEVAARAAAVAENNIEE